YTRSRFLRLTTSALYHDGKWNGSVALSGLANQFVLDLGANQYIDVTTPSITARGELMRSEPNVAGLTDFAWRLGGEALITHSNVAIALPIEQREGEPSGMADPNDTAQKFS